MNMTNPTPGTIIEPVAQCPLCRNHGCTVRSGIEKNTTTNECPYCGQFAITAEALGLLGNNGWMVAAFVKDHTLRGTRPTLYSSQQEVPAAAAAGSFGIDTAIRGFPATVPDRLDSALLRLAAMTKHLGQQVPIGSEGASPLLLAQNSSEVFFIIQQFEEAGFTKGNTTSLPTAVSLTAKGLNRAADLQRGLLSVQNKQVFIAMSFDKSLDHAWTDGLRLGIEACGCTALRVDAKEHNDKICDVIIAEIRKSKFLVADFTLHRAGVYFEAGLMMGLGRPVIFTCRSDDLKHAHFDTRQYNHIEWDTPAELREKLKRRIQATIAL
jgi:hypothetical protein